METKNARIEEKRLGYEDHGIFTFMLQLDYGGSGQGAGGYALDSWNSAAGKRVAWPHAIDLIARILNVVGVETWEELIGEHIRVRAEYTKVIAIGNLLTDEWLDFDAFMRDTGK